LVKIVRKFFVKGKHVANAPCGFRSSENRPVLFPGWML